MGNVARPLIDRLATVTDDAGAAGGAENSINVAIIDRAAAQRRAADIQRAGRYRCGSGKPGQRRDLFTQRASLRVRRQQRREQRL